jgi:Flp pilus assembly protein TadD
LAALVALAIYLPSLRNGFTYDDRVVVVESRFITDLGNIPKLLSKDYFRRAEEKSWRPVTTLSYFIDHALWGKRPFGYHLTNLLLHAATAGLVVLLLLSCRAPPVAALLGGLLFALHPVATAAVESVSFRDDLLAALFVVSGLAAYRSYTGGEGGSSAGLYLGCVFYAAGCLSKENAVVLPALAWAVDAVVDGRPLFSFDRRRRLALGSMAVVGLAYAALRFGPMAGPAETYRYLGGGLLSAAATAWAVLFRAARLLLVPTGLSPVRWVEPVGSLADPMVAGGLALAAACLVLGWRARRKTPRVSAALAFMALSWLPVCGIVPLTHPLADRYLYLPLVGFCWLVAEGLFSLGSMPSREARVGAVALAALVAFGWAGPTLSRHSDWRDDLSLWSSAVANEPASYRAHYNLGDALYKADRMGEAEGPFRKALALKPVFSLGHYSLGRLLYKTGRKAEAAEQFLEALADKPDYAEARNHLGVIFEERGELGRARAEYEATLGLEPSNANALNNLGVLSARQGKTSEAEAYFRRASAADPYDPRGFTNLGSVLVQEGRTEEARQAFNRALALAPGFEPARRGLASLGRGGPSLEAKRREAVGLARQGRGEEAIALLRAALAERPDAVGLRHTLATTLLRAGRYEEARGELLSVLEHRPRDVLALRRLASLERRAGRPSEALRYLDVALSAGPSDAALLTEWALTLGQAARLKEAEEAAREATSVGPDFAPAHEVLGRLLLASGRPEEAASAFRRALELDPSLETARRGLAEAQRLSSSR